MIRYSRKKISVIDLKGTSKLKQNKATKTEQKKNATLYPANREAHSLDRAP